MRHKFLLVTVKQWLKSVLNYQSYPEIKLGIRYFGPPCMYVSSVRSMSQQWHQKRKQRKEAIFVRTQDKATTRQPGILCGWSGRLEQSPTGHSFGTYIISFLKCWRHIFSNVPTSLTNCIAENEQRTLYSSLVVTLAMFVTYKDTSKDTYKDTSSHN